MLKEFYENTRIYKSPEHAEQAIERFVIKAVGLEKIYYIEEILPRIENGQYIERDPITHTLFLEVTCPITENRNGTATMSKYALLNI